MFASVSDPLRMIGPVTIAYKIFMQKIWKIHVRWDDTLGEQLKVEWKEISKERVNNLNIRSRNYFALIFGCHTEDI